MNPETSSADRVAGLYLPAETAADCDRTIDPLLALLREGKEDEARLQIQTIDDDVVHTVGRRTCERWVAYKQTEIGAGMLALAAIAYGSPQTSQNIQRNHADEQRLLSRLEGMFMCEYDRRAEERRLQRETPLAIPIQS
jgi:hypothetical protein